ncbi:MAG TPA: M48 family metalloprotease [Vicinamibacterales bacterium]|nr:M48 family metalloprotease [Vicinamibacterales bacterium]
MNAHPADARTQYTVTDRETFDAAIERHQRAAWRVTTACAVAVAVLAIVVAILMAPLLYCAIGLLLDALNFFTPTPDLLGSLGRQIDTLSESATVDTALLVRTGLILAAPGVALMVIAAYALRRAWTMSPLFTGGDVPGRAPDRTVLQEERLANVVEEMAIAAGIPPPRVLIVPGGFNAAACGTDEAHVTLLVGAALAAHLTRESLEGMIAHLIASVVDGDMPIGVRVTTTLSLFGLLARVGSSFTDQHAMAYAMKLWRVFVAPKSAGTLALLSSLTEPFHDPPSAERAATPSPSGRSLTWREWLMMPLMGPVLLTGFLSGLVSQMFLQPLIAFAWRQRKYMADATAVQLTRNPDALAGALVAIADSPAAITPWTAHLAVADPRAHSGPFGRSIVPIVPSPEKRVAALRRMGAHVSPKRARRSIPWPLALFGGALVCLVAAMLSVVVFLLVMVSTAISGLFTIFPTAALHLLLRWAAAHAR